MLAGMHMLGNGQLQVSLLKGDLHKRKIYYLHWLLQDSCAISSCMYCELGKQNYNFALPCYADLVMIASILLVIPPSGEEG
jgi:hypothetical protein